MEKPPPPPPLNVGFVIFHFTPPVQLYLQEMRGYLGPGWSSYEGVTVPGRGGVSIFCKGWWRGLGGLMLSQIIAPSLETTEVLINTL